MSDEETLGWLESIFPDEDNPYKALDRVLALKSNARKRITRLTVWCEWHKCAPLRVFDMAEGLLVQCQSDAHVGDTGAVTPDGGDWARRRAFFIAEWEHAAAQTGYMSRLQIVCKCRQTEPRLVDVEKLIDAIPEPGDTPRNIALPDIVVPGV